MGAYMALSDIRIFLTGPSYIRLQITTSTDFLFDGLTTSLVSCSESLLRKDLCGVPDAKRSPQNKWLS